MKTTLVIMAAGIGSRYGGGIKQLASAGPSGEILMDYSIYDALRAGFDKILFLIRHDIEADFRAVIGTRIERICDVDYAFQELSDLPSGFTVPNGRTKPWGTGQAILVCRQYLKTPFAVINADDFYGAEAFRLLHGALTSGSFGENDVCLAGYILGNTLSENGGVTRGLCTVDGDGCLLSVRETKNIRKENGVIRSDTDEAFSAESYVSMNMWGLPASFPDRLADGFASFLGGLSADDTKSEFLLPIFIDGLVREKKVRAKLLPTRDKWFGLTYKEDLPAVQNAVSALVRAGVYPENLLGSRK